MIQAGTLDLQVPRWTPFVYYIDFPGIDFTTGTGAVMAMDVRLYRDAPGSAQIALANAASDDVQGLRMSVATVDGLPVSTLRIRIEEATIEGVLLNSGKAGADVSLVWDLHITGGGFIKTRWLEGAFTIKAGVTQ